MKTVDSLRLKRCPRFCNFSENGGIFLRKRSKIPGDVIHTGWHVHGLERRKVDCFETGYPYLFLAASGKRIVAPPLIGALGAAAS